MLLIAANALPACASGLKALEDFVRGTQTGRAEFTQVVTPPPKDGQAQRSRTSIGRFEFARPDRFRFAYLKPYEQTIVADGQTLWLHDADLNQVTARAQAQALGSTPAALIASATDLTALRRDFTLQDLPERDGLQWVAATPRARDGTVQSVRIGFKPNGELSVLEMADSFGQLSTLRFGRFESNPALPPDTFRFRTPAGATVLRQ